VNRHDSRDISDIGGIHAGVATTRLPAGDGEQERRERKHADARANLAAMCFEHAGIIPHRDLPADDPAVRSAIDDWALLADILGLVERDTRPSGRCACGAELRLSRGGNRDEYTAWLLRQCTACAKAAGAV
jgi:hypothetical protein